jgi:hypothetical protein
MLGIEGNEGRADRIFRVVLGLAILVAGFAGLLPGLTGTAARIFGWIPLVTGLVGWCPFYAMLGIRTCPR